MNKYYLIGLIFVSITGFSDYCCVRAQNTDTAKIHRRLQEVEVLSARANKTTTLSQITDANTLITTEGASAADILRHIPSFTIDMDGNLRWRGSNKVTILIDGQPSSLMREFGNEMLMQMPANVIEKIEVNPHPGAGALPDGEAGIINIVTQKTTAPFPVSLYTGFANNKRYSAGANALFRLDKWTFTAGVDYKKEYRERSFDNVIRNIETGSEELQNNTAVARPQSAIARLGVEYRISESALLGVTGSYWGQGFRRDGNVQKTTNGNVVKVLRDNKQRNDDASGTVYYTQLFGKSRDEMTVRFSYRNGKYDENNTYYRRSPLPEIIQYKLFVDQLEDEYNGSLSYKTEIGASQWNFGYQWRNLFTSFTNRKELPKQNDFVPDDKATYGVDISHDIHTLYGEYAYRTHLWLLKAGVRAEYAARKVSDEDRLNYKSDYFRLYPSAEINCNDKYILSYAQRVNRPLTEQLNPFLNKADITSPRIGNPRLKPEITDEILFRVNYSQAIVSVSPSLFYRHKRHTISMIVDADNISHAVNLRRSQSSGLECVVDVEALKWFKLGVNGTVAYDEIDASGMYMSQRKSNWWGQFQATVSCAMTSTTLFQMTYNYISDMLTPQGTVQSRDFSNVAIKQQFYNNKGAVTLAVEDWLGKGAEVTVIDTPLLYKETKKSRDRRRVNLSVSWNF